MTSAGDQGAVDALVTSLHPDVGAPPAVQTRDVILVTGPWLAGSTSVADVLRQRLGERTFVEAAELDDDDAPAAVVFVTPALAPLTGSDGILLDAAAANTDLVIGVVSKIDVHPAWRDIVAGNQAAAAARNPRYSTMTWVGAAAAPETGKPRMDDLVEALEEGLAHSRLSQRNRLRVWETRLGRALRQHEEAAAGVGREARVVALRQERSETLQQRRQARSDRHMAQRGRVAEAKEQLTDFARNRCESVRAELGEDAAKMTRRRLPEFQDYVARRIGDVVAEVHGGVGVRLGDLAAEFGLPKPPDEPPPAPPPVAPPPLTAGSSRTRLLVSSVCALFGLAIALGIVVAVSRMSTRPAPVYTTAALIGGAVLGLVAALLAIRMRRVARDRKVLDRWVTDAIGELRAIVESHVATRMHNAEPALAAEPAQRDEVESGDVSDRIASIDRELREHAVAAAQAKASRDRELPALQRALDAVHAALNGDCLKGGDSAINGDRARNFVSVKNGDSVTHGESEAENDDLNRSCE